MSRKTRSSRALAVAPTVAAPNLAPRSDAVFSPYGGLGVSGWQGANWSSLRGYVYWPSIDPQREVDSYSRLEIARKTHYLCSNVGLARRIVEGLTNLIVGTGLTPHAMTKDPAWNALAEKAYNSRAKSPLAYSVNGRMTSVQAQRMMVRTRMRDGDAAVLFAKSQGNAALRSFYSGIQVSNVVDPKLDQSKWTDGIQYDSLDRAQNYRFVQSDGSFTDVPAQNVRFLCRYDAPGHRRGMSVLAGAINKMIDITELNTAVMQGIKNSSRIGYYLTSSDDEKRQGMDAALGGKKTKVQTPNGPVTLKLVYGNSGEIVSLPKGVDIKTLLDQRPHPNSREFVDDFIRDVSWYAGVSSDLLWNITKLGGANVRYILADAQVFVGAEQQDLVDTWLAQDWVWTLALEMKYGRLRACQDPEWWTHGWVPPARVTVDYGRDGRVLLEFYKSGLITTERFYSMQGQTARDEVTKELDFIQWRKKEMATRGLTADDLQLYNQRLPAAHPAVGGGAMPADEVQPDPEQEPDGDDFDESTDDNP